MQKLSELNQVAEIDLPAIVGAIRSVPAAQWTLFLRRYQDMQSQSLAHLKPEERNKRFETIQGINYVTEFILQICKGELDI